MSPKLGKMSTGMKNKYVELITSDSAVSDDLKNKNGYYLQIFASTSCAVAMNS